MRNTTKRRLQQGGGSITTQTLLDFDLGESSSDSDFRIEDHEDESDDCSLGSKEDYGKDDDDDDDNDDEDDDDADNDDDDDDDADDDDADDDDDEDDCDQEEEEEGDEEDEEGEEENGNENNDDEAGSDDVAQQQRGGKSKIGSKDAVTVAVPRESENGLPEGKGAEAGQANARTLALAGAAPVKSLPPERDAAIQKLLSKPICCACLGDRSDDQNEIVECDGCGVTVHEGCYGVSESTSISSTVSSCSTEPWFCDACKAGVENPDCELCPNRGGIFKETDVGKWVHLVCALYVPGVAFGEVDQLSSVTLFEMPYNKWGAKTCSLCEDARLARTGVCIGCDAGMCKTYFHVTCAQYMGFLSEAHSEEADQADPFYAHCRIHSDKTLIKHRRRNYNAIKVKAVHRRQAVVESCRGQKPTPEQLRIERKLTKHRRRYVSNKEIRNAPWVPTQKMPRLLITSATACKKLLMKAELMGLDVAAIEFQEAQTATLHDVRKKWHIAPAFSVEFIGYYLDRSIRLGEMKKHLQEQMVLNKLLLGKQQLLRTMYDRAVVRNQEAVRMGESLRDSINSLYAHLLALCPNKALVPIELIGKPPQPSPSPLAALVSAPVATPVPAIAAQHAKTHPVGASGASPLAGSAAPYSKSVVINAPSTSSGLCTTPTTATRTMSVPTAAALKMGVGFPLQNLMVPGKRDDTGRILSTQCKQQQQQQQQQHQHQHQNQHHQHQQQQQQPNGDELLSECGICKRCTDQHLLAKCDTCHLHYHLGCLNPPLTRHPKKSKLYGWQCSECDKSDDSNPETVILPKAPRKSRTRYSKDGTIVPYDLSYEGSTADGREGPFLSRSDPPYAPAAKKLPAKPTSEATGGAGQLDSTSTGGSTTTSPETPTKSPGKRGRKRKVFDQETITNICGPQQPVVIAELLSVPLSAPALAPVKVPVPETVAVSGPVSDSAKATSESEQQHNTATENKKLMRPSTVDDKRMPPATASAAVVSDEEEITSGKMHALSEPAEADAPKVSIKGEVGSTTSTTVPPSASPSQYDLCPGDDEDEDEEDDDGGGSQRRTNREGRGLLPSTAAAPTAPALADDGTVGCDREPSATVVDELTGFSSHHKHSKRRKEKHRNRSPTDERIASKEHHKRKRKRKNHHDSREDLATTASNSYIDTGYGECRPRIKIKIKSVFDGSNMHTTEIYYVRNDTPAEDVSVNDLSADCSSLVPPQIHQTENALVGSEIYAGPASELVSNAQHRTASPHEGPVRAVGGRARGKQRDLIARTNAPVSAGATGYGTPMTDESVCDVCQTPGTSSNIVQCDECHKNYHFGCLEPPLKKTPKRRGYSWHCADCDPTDIEN
uniref:Putative phd finger protein n=1 Tax=Anopheles triannulatus TaxID=58253 RepID=A0A2M4A5V2_9DIPT